MFGLGRPTKIVIAGLEDASFDYDSAGRPWHAIRGTRTQTVGYTATLGAADNGYLSSLTYADLKSTTFLRDAFGRPTSVTDRQLLKTNLGYDLTGNLKTVESPKSVGSSTQTLHSLVADGANLLASYTPPVLPPLLPQAADVATSYFLDRDQAFATIQKPGNVSVAFDHDSVTGKLTKISGPSGATSIDYYPTTPCLIGCSPGAVRTLSSPSGETLTIAYDGPLVTSTTFSGLVSASVARQYDASFRVKSQDVADEASTSKLTFAYDSDDLLTCASTGACNAQDTAALRITRGASNALLSGTTFGKISDSYTFSTYGELRSYSATFAEPGTATTPLMSITYDDPLATLRDPLGRVVQQVETVEGVQHTIVFSYYDAGWLHTVSRDGTQTAEYAYDDNGNRLSQTTPSAGTVSAIYDDQDRLSSYGDATFEYTANGELKTKTSGSSVTKYAYDEYGSLRGVTLPDNSVVNYAVDALGRRVEKQVGTQRVRWVYDGSRIVAELDGSGTLVSRFLYGSRPNVPDAVIKYSGSTSKRYRILSDQAGSPRLVVNDSDQSDRPFRASYDEFGVVSGTGLAFIPFGFAGGLYDPDTGLVRFGARDYDPLVGRWTSKDPMLFGGRQANLYAYVGDDPINRIDPEGLYTEVVFWEPVGFGSSSFGHVSVDVNGTTYSLAPGGIASPDPLGAT